ncbi:unnamed protein product [Chrysoparadoxa australica]
MLNTDYTYKHVNRLLVSASTKPLHPPYLLHCYFHVGKDGIQQGINIIHQALKLCNVTLGVSQDGRIWGAGGRVWPWPRKKVGETSLIASDIVLHIILKCRQVIAVVSEDACSKGNDDLIATAFTTAINASTNLLAGCLSRRQPPL